MATNDVIARVCEELSRREPIFHRADAASTLEDFERMMAPDYWEIGASGGRYDRDFILEHLRQNAPVDAATAGWTTTNMHCRQISIETFLMTYELNQAGRLTQRATLWRWTGTDWQILYHQGTLISAAKP